MYSLEQLKAELANMQDALQYCKDWQAGNRYCIIETTQGKRKWRL
jgi:hypothetical protein